MMAAGSVEQREADVNDRRDDKADGKNTPLASPGSPSNEEEYCAERETDE